MVSKIANALTDDVKELAKNIGITMTNLLFLIEMSFLFFSKDSGLSKLIISQNKYIEFSLRLYKILYEFSTFIIFLVALIGSLILLLFFYLPESLEKEFGVQNGFENNTSRGFTSAAVFQRCWTFSIYYSHNLWIYLTALYIITGQVTSFKQLNSLTEMNWVFIVINALIFIGSLFYINVPTFYYEEHIDLANYLILNSTDKYALVKNLDYEHPLFFLVKLNSHTPNKGTVEVYSSGFAEVKYAFDNVSNRTIKPCPVEPAPVQKIDPSEFKKLSMTRKEK